MDSFRMPITGVYKIRGVGDVVTGTVEQGRIYPGTEVVFIPSHKVHKPCSGTIKSVEIFCRDMAAFAPPGRKAAPVITGLNKENMPKVGDVMVFKTEYLK